MAAYTIRIHHNETNEDAGETREYDISEPIDYTAQEIQMRMMEAMNINLANLAASLERVVSELRAMRLNA